MSEEIKKNLLVELPKNIISVGITWIDGRAIFKPDTKWSKAYYGICHYSKGIFIITPLDFIKPLMLTTIGVADDNSFCERASCCLNFDCKMNRFTKSGFSDIFKDCGPFSLGLPQSIEKKETLWFNMDKYKKFWGKLIISPEGGTIKFNPNKSNLIL